MLKFTFKPNLSWQTFFWICILIRILIRLTWSYGYGVFVFRPPFQFSWLFFTFLLPFGFVSGGYMEAVVFANEATTDEGWLKSPPMTSPLSGCLTFQYLLIGSPAVGLDVGGIWSENDTTVTPILSLRGDFGASWRKASVRFDSASYRSVIFVARGVDAVSHIAVDDIRYPVEDCEPGEIFWTFSYDIWCLPYLLFIYFNLFLNIVNRYKGDINNQINL